MADFVYGFSFMQNIGGLTGGIIIPNGRIDLLFCKTSGNRLKVMLMGLETKPKYTPENDIELFFAVSFNPPGLEYILQQPVAGIVDSGMELPAGFWGFEMKDLDHFDSFYRKAVSKISSLMPATIDNRKRQLFELIFSANGEISVKELAHKIFWSERQINRYFNQQFGVSLKTYCNILRFQASLEHIKDGRLFPEGNFTDQSHFIKEIKKRSGVSPKELFKNQNGRFLQFLVYNQE